MTDTSPSIRGWPVGPTLFERRFGNAKMRVLTAIIAIPIFLGAVWLGGWVFRLFVLSIALAGLYEFYAIASVKIARPHRWIGFVASGLLMATFGMDESLRSVVAILLLATLATLVAQMFRQSANALLDISATLAGILYVPLCLATLIGIRDMAPAIREQTNVDPAQYGAILIFAVMVSIWTCDSLAYYVGRSFGKHKLFERVSPKKTWEGAAGGVIGAVGATIACRFWLLQDLTIVDAIAIGAIIGVVGPIGDLAESHLKRNAGIKDSSQVIPGHGGVLDRFDSLLFVAPVIYFILGLYYRW